MIYSQTFNFFSGLLPAEEESNKELSKEHLSRTFTFAMMWSLGALLELDDRCNLAYIRFLIYYLYYLRFP